MAACRHLATAARVKYPAALQRCKFDAPLLAAGYLTYNVPLIEEHKIVNRNNNRKVQVSNYVTRQAVWQLDHIRQRKDRYDGHENRNGL